MTFIYALKEPDTGEIRYIGKADVPDSRLFQHIREARNPKLRTHKDNWIRSLLIRMATPGLEILDEVAVENWPQWEVAWIEFFQESGSCLVNSTPGGDGIAMTPEIKEKISVANTGVPKSLKHRENMSLVRLGKRASSETKLKMSVSHAGKTPSLGKRWTLSDEAKRNHSVALLGNKNSLGHKDSVETRQKRIQAQRARREREKHEKN